MFFFLFSAAKAEILGAQNGQDIYVKNGQMVNLTCLVSGTNAPPKHIFWYFGEKVSLIFSNSAISSQGDALFTMQCL